MFDFARNNVNIINIVVQVVFLVSSILMIVYGSKMRKTQTSSKDKTAGTTLIAFGTATMAIIVALGVYVVYTIYKTPRLMDIVTSNIKEIILFFLVVFHFVGAVLLINYGRVIQNNDVVEQTPATGNLLIAYGSISLVFVALTMTASGRILLNKFLASRPRPVAPYVPSPSAPATA